MRKVTTTSKMQGTFKPNNIQTQQHSKYKIKPSFHFRLIEKVPTTFECSTKNARGSATAALGGCSRRLRWSCSRRRHRGRGRRRRRRQGAGARAEVGDDCVGAALDGWVVAWVLRRLGSSSSAAGASSLLGADAIGALRLRLGYTKTEPSGGEREEEEREKGEERERVLYYSN